MKATCQGNERIGKAEIYVGGELTDHIDVPNMGQMSYDPISEMAMYIQGHVKSTLKVMFDSTHFQNGS